MKDLLNIFKPNTRIIRIQGIPLHSSNRNNYETPHQNHHLTRSRNILRNLYSCYCLCCLRYNYFDMRTRDTKFMGITVWVDNLKSGEVFIPAGMLGDRFRIWLRTKEITWLENYGTDVICRSFLTDKAPGCQGTFDEKEFAHVHKYLGPLLISYLSSQWK